MNARGFVAIAVAVGIVGACGDSVEPSQPAGAESCGDGTCGAAETAFLCPEDCYCGDGICETGETPTACPEDCEGSCGNGVCEAFENAVTCPEDGCTCGNGVCDDHESFTTCPEDGCTCGDGACDPGEGDSCPDDCPCGEPGVWTNCGDSVCDYATEICVRLVSTGNGTIYSCEPVPDGCEQTRDCSCISEGGDPSPFCSSLDVSAPYCEWNECENVIGCSYPAGS